MPRTLDRKRLKRELRAVIADLEWLKGMTGELSREEIARHLEESWEGQRRLLTRIDAWLASPSPGASLAHQLQTLSNAQRDLLVKIVERFHFGGKPDCAKAIGRENISEFVMAHDAWRGSPRGQHRLPGRSQRSY